MSDFGSAKSDRALRIRRAFFDRIHRMSTPFRMVTALLVVGACALTLPSIGTAQDRGDGDVDWHAARTTPPEEWSEELKAQIIAAGLDIEATAERIRLGQQAAREREQSQQEPSELDRIGREIREAVERGELTREEGRARYEAARERLGSTDQGDDNRMRAFQGDVIAKAMAKPPEEWSEELKAAIERAGWKLEEFTEGIHARQT
ncbi:MAG: hypothetical protein VX733_10890, partial [Candidatus Latescibacterota bacterium]|nr:hypothetical protein [Candidatus Latescibacterota bacterium]